MLKNYFKNEKTNHYFEIDADGIFVITEEKYNATEELVYDNPMGIDNIALESKEKFMENELMDLFNVESNSVESYYLEKHLYSDLFKNNKEMVEFKVDGLDVIMKQGKKYEYLLTIFDNGKELTSYKIDDSSKRLQDFIDSL